MFAFVPFHRLAGRTHLLLVWVLLALPVAARDLTDHLIADWKFDEGKGWSVTNSANPAAPATLFHFRADGFEWVSGRLGRAVRFNDDEVNDQVALVADHPTLNFSENGKFSISVWVKSSEEQENAGIVCKGFGSGGEQYALDIQGNRFRFYVRPETTSPSPMVWSSARPTGRWQHLVATFEASQKMALYLDGRLLAVRQTVPATLLRTDHPFSIASRKKNAESGYNVPFKGIIDDLRVYDVPLTADEVRELYLSAGPLLPTVRVSSQTNAVHIGRTASFQSFADGSEPLSFQWKKDGVPIWGATNSALELAAVNWSDVGSYTLQVTNPYGAALGAEIPLAVIPFFWQTWWFKLLPITLLIITVGGIVHFLERRKARLALQRMERIHAVDHERMRITRDLHDEIGAKLSRISFLSDMAQRSFDKESLAAKQIEEVAEGAREIIHSVDQIVWAVNPRNDTLSSLIHYICRHAEEFYELTSIELQLELPAQIPVGQLTAEVRHHLFCATKEALSNTLKHAAATKVWVSFRATPGSFQVLIRDNGRGFHSLPPAHGLDRTRQRNGLMNIHDRMNNIQGVAKLESSPDTGTTVSLTIPLDHPPSPR